MRICASAQKENRKENQGRKGLGPAGAGAVGAGKERGAQVAGGVGVGLL